MWNATRLVVSTFGVVVGVAGVEHGIGEMVQGSAPPPGLFIESWPKSAFFDVVGGEPAVTIVPNLLAAGVLTVLVSIAFMVWAVFFIRRPHGGPVLIAISLAMLLAGGGVAPPILGVLLGFTATRIDAPLAWWRAHLAPGAIRFLARLFPWVFGLSLLCWLLLFPGLEILSVRFAGDWSNLMLYVVLGALGTLGVSIVAAFAHDIEARPLAAGEAGPRMVGAGA